MSSVFILQFFIFSVGIHLFSMFTYIIYYSDVFTSNIRYDMQSEYDFIIVGSGTAGSLIAHRIATETNHSYIVLEAGGKGHFFHDIPAFGPLLHQSVHDWQYETVPQQNACFAMENNKCKQTQGKMFGGSSKLNNMVHVRGNTSHYVQWFQGKYTHKYIEDQLDYLESTVFHLDNIQYKSKLSDAVIKAAKELDFKEFKREFEIGFQKAILTQNKGKRWTTSHNIDRLNHVFTNVLVEKVFIENNKCKGVQIDHGKGKIFARKGVIVSAGTFNSAKILQLSGIGPKELLNKLDIPVIKNLPVGQNLQDHIGTGLDFVLFNETQSVGMFDIMNLLNVYEYFAKGRGPLTTPGCEVIGFADTKNGETPDLQYMVLPVGISADRGSHLRKSLGVSDKVWNNYFVKIFEKYAATFFSILLHPKSRGEVKIQSKDPHLPPLIDPKYLSNKDDIKTIVRGIKLVRKIIETKSMRDIGAYINNIPFPGCENFDFFSDSYLECYIQHLTLTSYHPVGTCSMGLPGFKTSVVDTSFRVLGVDNLFVVDGSVLPTIPSGNINAAIAMMANIFFENKIKSLHLKTNKIYQFCKSISFRDIININKVCKAS